jgi:tetratricopeptide (TPR) repeat protein
MPLLSEAEIKHRTEQDLNFDLRKLETESKVSPPNYFSLSRVTNNVGMEHYMLGNYIEAERFLNAALTQIRNIPAEPIPSSPNLGSNQDLARYQDIVARVRMEGGYAHNLAQVYFKQKKYKEAESMYKISVAAAEANPQKTLLNEYRADYDKLKAAMSNQKN